MNETVDATDESMKESRKRSAVEANIPSDLDLGGQRVGVASHGRFRTSGSDGFIGWSCDVRTHVDCFFFFFFFPGKRPRENDPQDAE